MMVDLLILINRSYKRFYLNFMDHFEIFFWKLGSLYLFWT